MTLMPNTSRAAIDTASLLVKSCLTLMLVSRTQLDPAIVFSLAQIAFALVTLVGYGIFAGPDAVRSLRWKGVSARRCEWVEC